MAMNIGARVFIHFLGFYFFPFFCIFQEFKMQFRQTKRSHASLTTRP